MKTLDYFKLRAKADSLMLKVGHGIKATIMRNGGTVAKTLCVLDKIKNENSLFPRALQGYSENIECEDMAYLSASMKDSPMVGDDLTFLKTTYHIIKVLPMKPADVVVYYECLIK